MAIRPFVEFKPGKLDREQAEELNRLGMELRRWVDAYVEPPLELHPLGGSYVLRIGTDVETKEPPRPFFPLPEPTECCPETWPAGVPGLYGQQTNYSSYAQYLAAAPSNPSNGQTWIINSCIYQYQCNGSTYTVAKTTGSGAQYYTAVWTDAYTLTGVSPGSSGQVLTSNGASANPSYQALPASGTASGAGGTVTDTSTNSVATYLTITGTNVAIAQISITNTGGSNSLDWVLRGTGIDSTTWNLASGTLAAGSGIDKLAGMNPSDQQPQAHSTFYGLTKIEVRIADSVAGSHTTFTIKYGAIHD